MIIIVMMMMDGDSDDDNAKDIDTSINDNYKKD